MYQETRSLFETKGATFLTEKIISLIKEQGGNTRRKYGDPFSLDFYLGENWGETEEGDSYKYPNQIGQVRTSIHGYPEDRVDERGEKYEHITRSRIYTYTFSLDAKHLFPQIIATLPDDCLYRVIENSQGLTIHVYDDVEQITGEIAKLKRLAEPLQNGIILFGQGEWVVVDGNKPNHIVVGFGQSPDACRQFLIYDPETKQVAASHLDLIQDLEVVQEMSSHLVRKGCKRRGLLLRASSNVENLVRQRLSELFPGAIFDLDDDFMFDAASGQFIKIDDTTKNVIYSDANTWERFSENTLIRIKYGIPQLLVYQD